MSMNDLQSVIFKVMNHFDMIPEKENKPMISAELKDIDIYDIDVVKPVEKQTQRNEVSMLIQSRVNLIKTITMFEKQEIDTTDLKQKLEDIDNEISSYFDGMDKEEITYEQFDQCVDIYNMLKEQGMDDEVERIKQRVDYLQSQLPTFNSSGMMITKHQQIGINYEDPETIRIVNHPQDDHINKLIKMVDAEYTDVHKEKEAFIEMQNEMRRRLIEKTVCEVADFLEINDIESVVKNIQKYFQQNWFKIQDIDNIKNNLGKIAGKCPKKQKEEKINMLTEILCKIIAAIYIIVEKNDSYDIAELYKKNFRKDIFKEETDEYTGMNYKVVKGPLKGLIGTVIHQVRDYCLMTKDIYGKNLGTTVPSLDIFKIKKSDIKKIACQYEKCNDTFNRPMYSQLIEMAKKNDDDIFALAKYTTVCTTEDQQLAYDNYDALFSYALELYNKMKKDQLTIYNEYNSYAATIKKLQADLKEDDIEPDEFILKQKELKQRKSKFVGLNKIMKSLDIKKSNIFFGFNKSNIKFKTDNVIEGDLEYLTIRDNSSKYVKKEKKQKNTIYTKENKAMVIKKSLNVYTQYEDLLQQI